MARNHHQFPIALEYHGVIMLLHHKQCKVHFVCLAMCFTVISNDENCETCTKCLDETLNAFFFLHLEPENGRFDLRLSVTKLRNIAVGIIKIFKTFLRYLKKKLGDLLFCQVFM